MAAAGITDHHISHQRSTLFDFIRYLGRPVWTAESADADRYLVRLRTGQRQAQSSLFSFNPLTGITTPRPAGDPNQTLAEVTGGAVHHDGPGGLPAARRALD